MTNRSSQILNRDFDHVQIYVRHRDGSRNLTLRRGEDDRVVGPSGEFFSIAWRSDSNAVSDAEMAEFGCDVDYGTPVILGASHCGRVQSPRNET